MTQTRASLIERAAEIYDFGAALRARDGFALPEVEEKKDTPSTSSGRAEEGEDTAPSTPVRAEPVEAPPFSPVPASSPVRRHAAIDRERLITNGFIVPGVAVTALAEEFRLIKRQLLTDLRDRSLKRSILICSARPNEGKTFCAINLALSLAAERDLQVLLVDADVAKPDVARRLGLVEDRPGLLDALADPAQDVESMVIDTDVERLSVLPAGTRSHADTEMLASAHAATVLQRLAAADPKRLILFDSPPALAASPASVLASHVGQVAMVVRADQTPESELREAVQLMDACAHLHLLLNAVSYAPGGKRFGSYYDYHEETEA